MLTLLAQNTTIGTNQLNIAAYTSTITPIASIGRLIEIGADAVLLVGTLALLVMLLMGAFYWITAGGEKGKIEEARNRMTQAIIGIIVLASVFAVYRVILNFIGLQNRIDIGGAGSAGGGTNSQICTPGTSSDDGGAGGYCTLNGNPSSTRVFCRTTASIPYPHWEPCACIEVGAIKAWGWVVDTCAP